MFDISNIVQASIAQRLSDPTGVQRKITDAIALDFEQGSEEKHIQNISTKSETLRMLNKQLAEAKTDKAKSNVQALIDSLIAGPRNKK